MPFVRRWLLSRILAVAPNRRLYYLFSGTVMFLLLIALWAELNNREHLGDLWQTFLRQVQQANPLWLAMAAGLMPLNWLAETQKWRQVVRQYESLSRGRALMAVWIGVSFSLFTPNRVGEYGGRILLVQPRNRWKATLATLVGNYSQLLVLLSAGLPAAWFFLRRHEVAPMPWWPPLGWAMLAGLALLYLAYFNLRRVFPFIRRIPKALGRRFLLKEATILRHFTTRQLSNLLGWSMLRYGIYATQYFLLLQFFGITPGIATACAGIATIFLIQTSLPLPPLTGLVARGNLAVWVWLPCGANALSSLAVTFLLWIINLILPALIGTFSLFFVQTAKTTGYDND